MEEEGFSSESQEFHNHTPLLQSRNHQNIDDTAGDGYKQSHRLPEINLQRALNSRLPLGLTLRKTPSFVELLEKMFTEREENVGSSSRHGVKMNDSDKLKATNFRANLLQIGRWQWKSIYDDDLIAKIYYAKRKIVWEILKRPLKFKIEIPWSNIIGIRAITPYKGEGTLEIELNQPPLFYIETNIQPRKHTLWEQSHDFTGGEASKSRRHYLQFAQSVLDRHYQMLLHCDERLYRLSHQRYPSQDSPFFDPKVPFNAYGNVPGFLPPNPYQVCPSTLALPPLGVPPKSPVVNFYGARMPNEHHMARSHIIRQPRGILPSAENIQVRASNIGYIPQFSNMVLSYPSSNNVRDARIFGPNSKALTSLIHTSSNNVRDASESFVSNGFNSQSINWMVRDSNENLGILPPNVSIPFDPSSYFVPSSNDCNP